MKRKKYEPAKGVVSLKWETGAPCPPDTRAIYLIEYWISQVEFNWNSWSSGSPNVETIARIAPALWNGSQWMLQQWANVAAAPMPSNAVIRRYACISYASNSRNDSLTLDGWK